MFAIIQSGGRQVRVEKDTVITIDHLDQPVGGKVIFDRVLFVDDNGTCSAGTPFIGNARVTGFVDEQGRGTKIRVFRKKRRKAWRRTIGHRTALTRVRITEIQAG